MVILFDGVCNLCNGFVRFVLKRDKKGLFQFACLQSKYGTALSANFNLPLAKPETIVLYDGEKIITQSDAVIMILRSLPGIWKSTTILYIVPHFMRNWFYQSVAKNRYKLFGKKDQCMVPDEDIKDRFLDNTIFSIN